MKNREEGGWNKSLQYLFCNLQIVKISNISDKSG